jgi:transcriptional regulator of heat shock response
MGGDQVTLPLTERQAHLLDLVIREYLETALPVASGSLARRHRLGCSPATVRKELAILEDAGFLSQPHTSAGRIPTALGHQYFVENLMSIAGIGDGEQITIRHQFHQAGVDLERWMRLSAAVMAQTSGVAGLVASERRHHSPRMYHAGLTQILFVPEFTEDIERLRDVVEILEHGTGLDTIIALLPRHGVEVIIGGVPPLASVPQVTLILARFGGQDEQGGVLGVVGPTRLPYERAVPTVGFVADLLTELLAGLAA